MKKVDVSHTCSMVKYRIVDLISNYLRRIDLVKIPDHVLKTVEKLENRIGYTYRNKQYAINALVHSSFSNEHHNFAAKSNERLEFLGDAILDFVLSLMLYNNQANYSEGEMSKMRALIVCESSLNECAKEIGLGELIMLGKGEEANGGRTRPSILSDALEAIIGSIYLDGGMDEAQGFIMHLLGDTYQKAIKGMLFMDYKTALQEELQKSGDVVIQYKLMESSGPDHSKTFKISVHSNGKAIGVGVGKSKKDAEQMAARAALEKMGIQV
jgi:ribonuclease-3